MGGDKGFPLLWLIFGIFFEGSILVPTRFVMEYDVVFP